MIVAVGRGVPGYTSAMRAVWLEPDEDYLDQRHRWGLDRGDEVWDGVLHMAPFPITEHERVANELLVALRPIAERCGLEAVTAALFEHEKNYRKPDLSIARPDQIWSVGLKAPSSSSRCSRPNDESRDTVSILREARRTRGMARGAEDASDRGLRASQWCLHAPGCRPLVSSVLGVTIEQRDGQLVIGDAII